MDDDIASKFDKLVQLVQSLPTELYDEVFEFTFWAPNLEIRIDKHYRAPSTAQVSRQLRWTYTRQYYSVPVFYSTDAKLLVKWLKSIPLHGFLNGLPRIRYDFTTLHPGNRAAQMKETVHWKQKVYTQLLACEIRGFPGCSQRKFLTTQAWSQADGEWQLGASSWDWENEFEAV